MKRLQLCVLFLLIVLVVSGTAQSKSQTETKDSMLKLCFKLWKQTSFGWEEKQTERAAWILRGSDGRYQWMEWPYSGEHLATSWKGALPDKVIAQIHTHPNYGKPEPSKQDARVAREIKAPVYTVSGSGIWRVGPDGKITKEADHNWYRKIKE